MSLFSSPLYRASPVPVQDALLSSHAWLRRQLREGKEFGALLEEANQTQWFTPDELRAYQRKHLSHILCHAADTVPFYRSYAAAAEMASPDRDPIETLAKLPLLTKAEVREAGDRLKSKASGWPLFSGSTSGTTGSPLTLWQDLHAITRENAFLARQMHWAGWTPGCRRAWIRGDMVTPISQTTPPFWRTNHAERMLMLSSYHLSESNAAAYIEAIAEYGPTVIQAYPSSIGFLAAWLEATGRRYPGPRLKGVLTSSESLSDKQMQCIEERMGCRVFDWYGQFERVAAIGTCEHGARHLISDYSFVELLPADNGLHEIVGTGFNNTCMPLIRYCTGDYVELPSEGAPPCPCGRSFPVVRRVVGRQEDSLQLPDGRVVSRLDFIIKGVPGIIESQIRQTASGEVRILVVTTSDFSMKAHSRLLSQAHERLGQDVRVHVERVNEIARGRNGKHLFVVKE